MSWKKWLICVMMVVVLSGCQKASPPTQKAIAFRTALLSAGGCSFTSVIDADFGDRVYSFSVACTFKTDGTAELEVLQPEEIAGIRAKTDGQSAALEFEDIVLDFGVMADGKVSPMEACPLLGQCWTAAYISCAGSDGELERVTYLDGYEKEELTVDTWLDAAGLPVYAEISNQGTRCLSLQISDFRFEDEL